MNCFEQDLFFENRERIRKPARSRRHIHRRETRVLPLSGNAKEQLLYDYYTRDHHTIITVHTIITRSSPNEYSRQREGRRSGQDALGLLIVKS